MKNFKIAIFLLSFITVSAQASNAAYDGVGASLVNATIRGIETDLSLRCSYDGSNRLTMYFPGLLYGLKNKIICSDANGKRVIEIKVSGRENAGTQTFGNLQIKYVSNQATEQSCVDCTIRGQE
jgi:hypothetical protein